MPAPISPKTDESFRLRYFPATALVAPTRITNFDTSRIGSSEWGFGAIVKSMADGVDQGLTKFSAKRPKGGKGGKAPEFDVIDFTMGGTVDTGVGPLAVPDSVSKSMNAKESAAMVAAVRAKQADEAERIFDTMKKVGVEPNLWAYTTLMTAHLKVRNPARALEVLKEMTDAGHKPDVAAYTAIIAGFLKISKS